MAENRRKPSWPFWLLFAVVLVVGVGVSVGVIVHAVGELAGSMIRVTVPGTAEIALAEAGDYTIYHENVSTFGGKTYRQSEGSMDFTCRLAAPDGSEVALTPVSGHMTYSWGGASGYALWNFHADRPGTYVLTTESGEEAVLAVGAGFGEVFGSIMKAAFGGIGICLGAFLLGVLFLVLAIVRTVRNRRAARGAAAPSAV